MEAGILRIVHQLAFLVGAMAVVPPLAAQGNAAPDEALVPLKVGQAVAGFELPGVDGAMHGLDAFADAQAAVVLFIGNNCPCVEAYDERMVWMTDYLARQQVPVLAINANSADRRFGESLADMQQRADSAGYNFPYLIDEDQSVARRFRATRTPEAFVLGRISNAATDAADGTDGLPSVAGASGSSTWKLVYSGAIDDQPNKPNAVRRHYVNEAVHRFLDGQRMHPDRVEPMGCSIEGLSVQGKACPMEAMTQRVRDATGSTAGLPDNAQAAAPSAMDVADAAGPGRQVMATGNTSFSSTPSATPSPAANTWTLPVREGTLDSAWLDLRTPAAQLYPEPAREEAVLDLVWARTVDSVYRRKRARHRVVGGALLPYFGVRWKSVRQTREQVVGQVVKQSISGKERFTEYDVNFNLVPHRDRSLEVVYAAYADQARMFKARGKVRKAGGPDQPPYIPPNPRRDPAPYKIHVECTPARDLRDTLNVVFYPTRHPHDLASHPNIGRSNPVFGVYGPMVLDCNHKCQPEIHPYEWIWWRDAPAKPGAPSRWSIGLLRDVSNRMQHWSSAPREGAIRIPVLLDFSAEDVVTLELEPGPRSAFSAEGLWRWTLPEQARSIRGTSAWTFDHPALAGKWVELHTTDELPITAAWWWLEDAVWDADQGLLRAYLVMALSTQDAFTGWLTVP